MAKALRVGALVWQLLLAGLGGYTVSALASSCIALMLPMTTSSSRAEGVLIGTLLSFAIYTGIAIWVYSAHSLMRISVQMTALAGLLLAALTVMRSIS